MDDGTSSLSHTKWECKYHMVWIPKYRKKRLLEELRKEWAPVLRELVQHKGGEILEWRMLLDHGHMLITIPPKYAVSQMVGCTKSKSAIHTVRAYLICERNLTRPHIWASGYCVSTVGIDEDALRRHSKQQEDEDRRYDQMNMPPRHCLPNPNVLYQIAAAAKPRHQCSSILLLS